jgi:hypothetical protein
MTNSNNTGFLLKILVTLIIVFVTIQLYVLTTVGTQGQQVSYLRDKQTQLKLDNEIKKAKILELQTGTAIADTIESLQMKTTTVRYIRVDELQIVSQE